MDPCSEVMRFFKEAGANDLKVRYARFDVHGMQPEKVFCYASRDSSGKRVAQLTFDIHEPGIFGFTRTGRQQMKLDPDEIKIEKIEKSSRGEQSLKQGNTEIFRACHFPWWKFIWGQEVEG